MSDRGIVRRIDDLGRIVIPKEIRRSMRLREGEEMEIRAEEDRLIIKKYSEFQNFGAAARTVAAMISEYVGCDAYVVTPDKVIAASGKGKNRFVGLTPSPSMQRTIASRSSLLLKGTDTDELFVGGGTVSEYVAVEPVIVRGDLVGAVIALPEDISDENKISYIRFAAALLSAVLSD